MSKLLLTLSCAAIALTASLASTSFINASAETSNPTYENQAYQMHTVQDSVQNLFLSESVYNISNSRIQIKNSIRLKKTKSRMMSIVLIFSDNIESFLGEGYMRFYIIDDSGNVLKKIDQEITCDQELYDSEYIIQLYDDSIIISFDTTSFPEYFRLCGDEYASQNKQFYIEFPSKATLRAFDLENKEYSVTPSVDSLPTPKYGIAPNSKGIYTNGSCYNIEINYDNRLTVNDILKNIVAFDYTDNKELTKKVDNDTYSNALLENKLGEYSFNVSAEDSTKNKTTIKVNATIKDLTAPVIVGENKLSISYKELSGTNTIDISKYYTGNDNYDTVSCLQTKEVTVEKWVETPIKLHAEDSSHNHSTRDIKVYVIDDICPIIEGPSSIEFYQFEIKDDKYLLDNYFTFDDKDGSGISSYKIKKELGVCDYGKTGTYPITISCYDEFDNESTFTTKITIKDGVGPVFFINELNLSLTTSTLKTASEIISLAQAKNIISPIVYESALFIDDTYQENYDKEGSYTTRVVCYKKDGSRDYYQFNINVQKEVEKNILKRIFNSISNFFNRFSSFFRYIWKTLSRN